MTVPGWLLRCAPSRTTTQAGKVLSKGYRAEFQVSSGGREGMKAALPKGGRPSRRTLSRTYCWGGRVKVRVAGAPTAG
jgi:hypothetical protein